MKKKIFRFLFPLLFIFIFCGCPEKTNTNTVRVWIINESEQDIFFYVKFTQTNPTVIQDTIECPDTNLPKQKRGDFIKKRGVGLKEIDFLICDTLRVFILSPDTIAKYDWAQIRANNNYLVRHDILVRDIKEHDITIRLP